MPVKAYIYDTGILDNPDPAENEVDPALLRIPAPQLKGTFAKAYDVLTRIVSKVGWDELLRYRSLAFVMEAEYRSQKAEESKLKSPTRPVFPAEVSASPKSATETVQAPVERLATPTSASVASPIPVITIRSPRSDAEVSPRVPSPTTGTDAEKPTDSEISEGSEPTSNGAAKLSHKKLCERWLDSLFLFVHSS